MKPSPQKARKGSKMDIKLIKINGEIAALNQAIESRVSSICYRTFESYKSNNHYVKLGVKISESRKLLDQIDSLLKELHKLDGVSK